MNLWNREWLMTIDIWARWMAESPVQTPADWEQE
ncbi:hypothetical protein FB390_3751 [Nocardia bhagyanarayanae]|uniref:Uncharacterized protein n=1 Tax=Nocardia bhagyanarayanae TaxID=1215925 RepID=A0A543FDV9_9NOCA|nr:hypothetical protein FB390_3751 [Nocardia bhagyanarayanae]